MFKYISSLCWTPSDGHRRDKGTLVRHIILHFFLNFIINAANARNEYTYIASYSVKRCFEAFQENRIRPPFICKYNTPVSTLERNTVS